jgi:16S rRNA processing protein RimM
VPSEPRAPWPADAIEVGRIGEAWGLKGAFRVHAYAEPPLALLAASRWHLRAADEPRPASAMALPTTLEIANVRALGDGYVATSPAVADRTTAEALRGARVFVAGLLDNGAQSILRVQPPAAEASELLIPFVANYVDSVDLAGRRIAVDWQSDY